MMMKKNKGEELSCFLLLLLVWHHRAIEKSQSSVEQAGTQRLRASGSALGTGTIIERL